MKQDVFLGYLNALCLYCSTIGPHLGTSPPNAPFKFQYIAFTQYPYCLPLFQTKPTRPGTSGQPLLLSYDETYTLENPFVAAEWDDFFSNSDSENCPVTCIYEMVIECFSGFSSNFIVTEENNSKVKVRRNEPNGWSDSFCYICKVPQSSNFNDDLRVDVYIQQDPSPCLDKLSLNWSQKNIPYEPWNPQAGVALAEIISNSDWANCPIKSCSLLNQGCSTPFDTSIWNLSIDPAYPFAIHANEMIFDGISATMCIQCTNGAQVIKNDPYQLNQIEGSCNYALDVLSTTDPDPIELQYDVTLSAYEFATAQDFFSNKNSIRCPISMCNILQADCVQAYSGDNLSLSAAGQSWTANRSKVLGFNETICVFCRAGTNDTFKGNIKVNLVPVSCTTSSSTGPHLLTLNPTGTSHTIAHLEFSTWFQATKGPYYTGMCEIVQFNLFDDSGCTVISSKATISGILGSQVIQIPTIPSNLQSVFLCATDNFSVKVYKEIQFQVCGLETVSLFPLTAKVSLTFNSGTGTQKVLSSQISSSFSIDNSQCPITTYSLVQKSGALYTTYTGTDVYLDATNNLLISTVLAIQKTLYIKAASTYSPNAAYLPLSVIVSTPAPLVNFAPQASSPPVNQLFELNFEEQSTFTKTISLPTALDTPGDIVTTTVIGLPSFITFNSASQSLMMSNVDASNVGVYSLTMKLQDQLGASAQYPFIIEIKAIKPLTEEKSPNSSPEIEQEAQLNSNKNNVVMQIPGLQPIQIKEHSGGFSTFTPVYSIKEKNVENVVKEILEPKNTTAYIESISVKGLMTIKFNFDMMTTFNLTYLNSSIIQMYVVPVDDRHLENNNFNITTLNFTWETVSYFKNKLEIQLYFECPTCISPELEQDRIVVDLRNATSTGFFFSPENEFKGLHKKFQILQNNIRKQMQLDSFTEAFTQTTEETGTAMKASLTGVMIMNNFIAGMMTNFGLWINQLQMMLHLPMLHIVMPANVSQFFGIILPIAMFDIIESTYSTELVMEFDYETEQEKAESILGQMRDLGYEQHNSLLNLGSLAIFSVFYYVKLVFYWFLLCPFVFLTGYGKSLKNSMSKSMFYTEILILTIEAYIEFLISGWLNIKQPIRSTNGEVVAVYVGIYSLIMCIIVIPAVFIYVLKQPIDKINEPSFKQKWEGAFEGVKTQTKSQLAFFPVFVARRVIFVCSAFWLSDQPIFQILSCLLTNLAVMVYKGQYQPLITRYRNRVELFNELSIVLVHIHIVFFTDWIPDSQQQFNFGYSMIGVMVFNMVVNVSLIFYFAGKNLFITIKKIIYRLRYQSKRRVVQPFDIKKFDEILENYNTQDIFDVNKEQPISVFSQRKMMTRKSYNKAEPNEIEIIDQEYIKPNQAVSINVQLLQNSIQKHLKAAHKLRTKMALDEVRIKFASKKKPDFSALNLQDKLQLQQEFSQFQSLQTKFKTFLNDQYQKDIAQSENNPFLLNKTNLTFEQFWERDQLKLQTEFLASVQTLKNPIKLVIKSNKPAFEQEGHYIEQSHDEFKKLCEQNGVQELTFEEIKNLWKLSSLKRQIFINDRSIQDQLSIYRLLNAQAVQHMQCLKDLERFNWNKCLIKMAHLNKDNQKVDMKQLKFEHALIEKVFNVYNPKTFD